MSMLFVEAEARFLDAPADDLSVGFFKVGYTSDESEFDVYERALAGCKAYGLDPHTLKINL